MKPKRELMDGDPATEGLDRRREFEARKPKLKPCPFCVMPVKGPYADGQFQYVFCHFASDTPNHRITIWAATKRLAIQIWNTRKEAQPDHAGDCPGPRAEAPTNAGRIGCKKRRIK